MPQLRPIYWLDGPHHTVSLAVHRLQFVFRVLCKRRWGWVNICWVLFPDNPSFGLCKSTRFTWGIRLDCRWKWCLQRRLLRQFYFLALVALPAPLQGVLHHLRAVERSSASSAPRKLVSSSSANTCRTSEPSDRVIWLNEHILSKNEARARDLGPRSISKRKIRELEIFELSGWGGGGGGRTAWKGDQQNLHPSY